MITGVERNLAKISEAGRCTVSVPFFVPSKRLGLAPDQTPSEAPLNGLPEGCAKNRSVIA